MASDQLFQAYGVDQASDLLDTWFARERRQAAEKALRSAAEHAPYGSRRWLTRRANEIARGARL